GGVRARAARGGDDALLLPLAGAAVRRRAAPVPALAAARLPARAAPRRGALPVRARHVRTADARRRRTAVRRLRVAPAGRARRRGVRPARRRGGERMSEVAVTGAGDEPVPAREEFARDTARSAEGLLAEFNHPDGLSAADVHVARRLARLGGCDDEKVLVAAALAVRAVRQGSVCLDLASDRAQELLGEHAWEPAQWRAALLTSSLVREAADDAVTPLVLDGDRLYLDRYWGEEGQVVRDLQERRASAPEVPDGVGTLLDRYFPDADDRDQRAAAEAACGGWTTVVTGGPGTGKTTTIARLLGVLL